VGEPVGREYREYGTKTVTDAVPFKPTSNESTGYRERGRLRNKQRYDGTKQGTYEIGGRKRGTDVGRRGEREIQSGSGRNIYAIRKKNTCMDGGTCRHESDASYHRWQ